jgi:predicted  nucleic acid-binding Zn-ribbon protein
LVQAIQNLVQLQQLDLKLDQIERDKGDLPARVNESKKRLESTKAEVEKTKNQLSDLKGKKRRIESEIEILQEKKKHNDEKLYSVTTNKEYDAVTLEIEAVLKNIDENETELLLLLDEIEQAEKQLEALKTKFENEQKAHDMQSSDLQKKIAMNAGKERHLQVEKESITKTIPLKHLRLYNRIRPSKDGLAVVWVVRGACGGCFTQIPPQRVMEVRDQDKLIECESCGRILYWVDDKEEIPVS